jgi:hypothetical protein
VDKECWWDKVAKGFLGMEGMFRSSLWWEFQDMIVGAVHNNGDRREKLELLLQLAQVGSDVDLEGEG